MQFSLATNTWAADGGGIGILDIDFRHVTLSLTPDAQSSIQQAAMREQVGAGKGTSTRFWTTCAQPAAWTSSGWFGFSVTESPEWR